MKYLCCFVCYSLSFITYVYAQRETTQWLLGNKISINFNQTPPIVIYNEQAPQVFSQQLASICDKDGNLLFYTDSQTVWNRQNQVMDNGTNIGGERLRKVIIIPAPGKPGQYYIFTLGFINAVGDYFIDQHIVYALVDVGANNGAGAVVEKNKILYKNLHGSFTISAKCDNETYWLVGETNENIVAGVGTDRIYAYRIDVRGVSDTPVISSPISMKSSGGYKFSPASDKIVFSYEGNGPSATAIADFDQLTGKLSNLRNIDACCSPVAEFSSNGNILYISQDSTLLQFDLNNGNLTDILNSKKVIANHGSYIGGLQLAPDGKIYVSRANTKALSLIENPDQTGEACRYIPDGLPLPTDAPYYLPSFATNLLYNSPAATALAGGDKVVCLNEKTVLGTAIQMNATYLWEPADFLDNPNLPNPTFRYSRSTDTSVSLTYQVTVNDGICPRTDLVKVTVQPMPEQPQITGSRSVCPGIEGVAYQVKAQDGYTYQWSVAGGTIKRGQGSAEIQVDWAHNSPDASVQVTAINAAGCTSQSVLSVRTGETLQPETPAGSTQVCLNDKNGQLYKVNYTPGSVYTWGINGGEIVSGQGSREVIVNWLGEGIHQLWLQEESTTKEAKCYGASDTVTVSVFKDTSSMDIDFVSISNAGNNSADIQGVFISKIAFTDTIYLYRREYRQETWVRVAGSIPSGGKFTFTDSGMKSAEVSYQYKVATLNFCKEPLESAVHRTIHLAARTTEEPQQIELSWNAYQGWKKPVASYQIWRRLDDEEAYTLLVSVIPTMLSYTLGNSTDGFLHEYRVKAVESTTGYESWSNEVKLEFVHELYIPNVFTPNGDGANDNFEIKNIHLFPENELVIYNRWGREVYRRRGYTGEWQASDLPHGIYYYELSVNRLDRYYKGVVHILK